MKNAFLCSFASPSVWREWIEIDEQERQQLIVDVSLRVEGVD